MNPKSVFLVFGATGQTGRHFIDLALKDGRKVKALVRSPEKLAVESPNLELHKGSISDCEGLEELVAGVDFIVAMLGDAKQQRHEKLCAEFVKRLVFAMRKRGAKRFLYQAGGFTRPYNKRLPIMSWVLKNTVARFAGLLGQHRDNEAVLKYLVEEASDIDWTVHRASIISDGPSKGVLIRSKSKFSLATFQDCAAYNYRVVMNDSAIHTDDLSFYGK